MFQNIFHTIEQRKSCRTYSDTISARQIIEKLSNEDLHRIPLQAKQLFSPDVIMPEIRLLPFNSSITPPSTYGVIKGAQLYAALGIPDKNSRQSMVAGGILFENFILHATELGFATCWLGGTFGKSEFQKAFEANGGTGSVEIVSPVGNAAPHMRMSEKLMRSFVKSSSRKSLDSLFAFEEDCKDLRTASNGQHMEHMITQMLEMIRLAPSSRNSQPWRGKISYEDGQIIICISCINPGSKFAAIDMGIALCHLFGTAEALSLELCLQEANYTSLKFTFSIAKSNQTR